MFAMGRSTGLCTKFQCLVRIFVFYYKILLTHKKMIFLEFEAKVSNTRRGVVVHTCLFIHNNVNGRLKSDPQTGVDQRRALICNLRSECRCSMCPAIHTNSHSLLRPSSTSEPSDSPPRFLF